MHIVILKFEANIRFEEAKSTAIGLPSQEVVTFAKAMALHPKVQSVTCMTKIAPSIRMNYGPKLSLHDVHDAKFLRNMPAGETHLIFWNGYPIFWGGIVPSLTIENYARFHEGDHCHRYIINTDNRIPFISIENILRDKKMVAHLPFERFDPNRYVDTITHLTQSKDVEAFTKMYEDYADEKKVGKYVPGPYRSVDHIPLHLMPLFTHNMEFNENPIYDMAFTSQQFLTFKGYRRNLLKNYYEALSGAEFETVLTGAGLKHIENIPAKHKLDALKYHDLKFFLNKCVAQLALAEKSYEECKLYPNRIAEGVACRVVNFIHSSVDAERFLFPNEELINFLYVDDPRQVPERLRKLKTDRDFRKHITDLQLQCMGDDKKKQMIRDIYVILDRNQNQGLPQSRNESQIQN